MYSINEQRNIARKRAALDLFLKTELDKSNVDAYHAFEAAFKALRTVEKGTMSEFRQTPEYRDIRAYLNIHELIAVGIHQGVLDEDVCFEFWAGELIDAYRSGKTVVDLVREDSPLSYVAFERAYYRWVERENRER
jgi:hypothetical protein